MNEPRRLLADPAAAGLERQMLDAWMEERPSDAAREATLAALGVGAALTTTAAAAGSASIAPKAAASFVLAKWLVIGVVGLGLVSTGAFLALRRSDSPAPVPAPTNAPVTTPAPPPPAATTTVTSGPALDVDSLPEATNAAPVAARAVRPHASTSRSTSDGLGNQISIVDRARGALADGNAARAIELVGEYESAYPNGKFTQEAEVIRIEALLNEGDRAAARRVGEHFLDTNPTSPHAAHVRALIGSP